MSDNDCEIIMSIIDAIRNVQQGYYYIAATELESVANQLRNKSSVPKDTIREIEGGT